MDTLQVEVNENFVKSKDTLAGGSILITPPTLGEDYWLLRVKVSEKQAIVAFPKFGTIGIGFQVEEDWNTNLPYLCCAKEIFEHIKHNKGDDTVLDDDCIKAICLLQTAIYKLALNQEDKYG